MSHTHTHGAQSRLGPGGEGGGGGGGAGSVFGSSHTHRMLASVPTMTWCVCAGAVYGAAATAASGDQLSALPADL